MVAELLKAHMVVRFKGHCPSAILIDGGRVRVAGGRYCSTFGFQCSAAACIRKVNIKEELQEDVAMYFFSVDF